MLLSSNLAIVSHADAALERARAISNAVGKLPEDVTTAMAVVNTVRAWSYVPDSDLSVVDTGAPEDIPARLAEMAVSLTAFETANQVRDTALQIATQLLS